MQRNCVWIHSPQRHRFGSYCLANKNSGKQSDNENSRQQPRRLTQDAIRALGGLKNALKVIKLVEESSTNRKDQFSGKTFRKKKKTAEEYAAEKERIKAEEEENSRDSYRSFYGGADNTPHVLLVDGYNLLFEMIRQDAKRFEKLELPQRRYELEKDVAFFSRDLLLRVILVYDALGNLQPHEENKVAKANVKGMELIFCQGYEADRGLTVQVDKCWEEGNQRITVISSDRMVKEACSNPPFVRCKTSEAFAKEIRQRKMEYEDSVDTLNLAPRKNPIARSLSSRTLSDLNKVRTELRQQRSCPNHKHD